MGVLGFVLRTVVLWVLSLVVAIAGMEAAHRFVLARDRDQAATTTDPKIFEEVDGLVEGLAGDRGLMMEATQVVGGAAPAVCASTEGRLPERRLSVAGR